MKTSDGLRWCLLLADVCMAMPGLRRRQVQTTSSLCTCPANGPVTATVSQFFVFVYSTTITAQSGTVTSTAGLTSTEMVTASATATITTTTDTATITFPGTTQTTVTTSTTTLTVTTITTQTTCTASGLRKMRRQDTSSASNSDTVSSTTTASATGTPSVVTTTIGSRGATCVCRPVPKTTSLTSTSTCDCPATTATTASVTTSYTSSSMVTISTTVLNVIIVTPTDFSTTTVTSTVTSGTLASIETTQQPSTVTSQVIETVYSTLVSTVTSCPSSTSSSSSTTTTSSSSSPAVTSSSSTTSVSSTSSSTSSSAIPSQSGSLACNSTAYLIETTNSVPRLFNINLRTSTSIIINSNVGVGKYTNINGMGFNVLDNFLYAIGTISTTQYAVLRITATGAVQEVLRFTSSITSPGSSGDVDTNGQFWFTGGGGTVWRQVDLAPGSSTYGRIVNNGTTTLTGYSVYDWVYLPGQGEYMYSLATSTDSSPNLALLRWSQTAHTWSVYQEYANNAAPNSIIANWGNNNATIWGLAATSGQTTRVTLGGIPLAIGTAPSGLNSADGARCALATDG